MNKRLLVLMIIIVSATIMYFISGYFQTNTKPKKIITPSPVSGNNNVCPKTEWVDCLPGPGKTKAECRPQYLQWARENCPKFKGAAY